MWLSNVRKLPGLLLMALLLSVFLSACGWQLQGVRRVPERLSPLYLDLKDAHSPFSRSLSRRLREAGVNVTADKSSAQSILRIRKDTSGHTVSSVSALNEPQQYEVYYNVEYLLERTQAGAEAVLPLQAMNAARTISYDKTLALAKQREEIALRNTLADELASQVLRRLSLLSVDETAPVSIEP